MKKIRLFLALGMFLIPLINLFGGTSRPKDGYLSMIVILGFLGIILGILYLVDYLKFLIRKFSENNGEADETAS